MRECWVAEPITGEEFPYVLAQKILNDKSIDGLGDDWPIGYEDVKPYYDKIDKLIGVFGTNEGLDNDPDGIFLPPPKPRLHELIDKKSGNRHWHSGNSFPAFNSYQKDQ